MKKFIIFILLLVLSVFIGCAKNSSSDLKGDGSDPSVEIGGPVYREDAYYSGKSGGKTGESAIGDVIIPGEDLVPVDGEVTVGEGTQEEVPEPGQLTSSVYFDHDYFDFWLELLQTNQEGKDGLFKDYYNEKEFNAYNRVKLTFNGAVNVKVTIDDFTGVCDNKGVCYLFPKEYKEEYTAKIEYINNSGEVVSITKTVKNNDVIEASTLDGIASKAEYIQLLFVIDTTGSMGDEIRYLKSEIANVIENVKKENENVKIDLGLIFYRDKGDLYVTRSFAFTEDITAQVDNLSKQSADGGGDFPEDITSAFIEANKFQWSQTATKILVHVADAPDHSNAITTWNQEVLKLASLGVRIVTVASSGIDKATEYYYRSECLLTNGCYGYLTNDSGIGGEHIEATTKEKPTVEYLNMMLVRIIDGIYTGEFKEAIDWRQVPKEVTKDN